MQCSFVNVLDSHLINHRYFVSTSMTTTVCLMTANDCVQTTGYKRNPKNSSNNQSQEMADALRVSMLEWKSSKKALKKS
eukprot:6214827-Amphidinium_carterae.1